MHHRLSHVLQSLSLFLSLSLGIKKSDKKMRMTRDGKEHEYKKGLWTVEEDKILMDYVRTHGQGHWNRIAKKTGLLLNLSLLLLFLMQENNKKKY